MKIAIIGAGISGLAAGRFLDELGHEVELFESSAGPAAGLMESREADGYTFDVGGGHIIYTKDEWVSSFIDELYDDGSLEKHTRNTKIFYKGKFVKYPFENGLGDLPPEVNLECLKGFIQAHLDKPKAPKPTNFKEWIHYRMGPGIAKHFMVPYNEKIWDGDLEEIGVDWVSGRVPEAPLEDIIRSSLGCPTEGYTHQSTFYYPSKGGIHDLAVRVGEPVLKKIHFSHTVKRIERTDSKRFRVDSGEFDEVIYTAPLDKAPGIVAGMSASSARAAESLKRISLTTFLFGLEAEDAKPLSWIYLPTAEEGPANRLTYLSNYSPNNAPDGKASILVEVTHRNTLNVDSAYVKALRGALEKSGFLKQKQVDLETHGTVEYAYILFDRDFSKKRQAAIEGLEKKGIHPLGRFGAYRYLNMDHCIIQAKDLAEKIHASSR